MSIGLILLVVLILLLIGALPSWGHSRRWGYGPSGGLGLVLWAIPLRLVLVYHVTWLVNSATHAFGYRNFDCPDLSRNCWWVAILSFGEGWHNNHHAFPHSARHGFGRQIDLTWQHIKLMRRLGLATQVRLPRAAAPGTSKALA